MSTNIEKLMGYKKKLTKLEKELSETEGALKQLMSTLEEEFGCSSIEEAKKRLAKLEAEHKESEEQLNQMMKDFERSYGEQLAITE